jgi:hypothetical protein
MNPLVHGVSLPAYNAYFNAQHSAINTLAFAEYHSLSKYSSSKTSKTSEDQYQHPKKAKKSRSKNDNVHPHHHPLAPLLPPTLHQHRTLP